MPKLIKWPDGREEVVEDHLALLWEKQGRAQIITPSTEHKHKPATETKDVQEPVFHRSVKRPPVKK